MDYNYNRIVLEQYLDNLFRYILKNYNESELKKLFNDLITGKESTILNKNIQNELNKFSKDTIRLIIEKNILFSLENSVVNIKKTYWKVLKDRTPKMNVILLSHYYDKYIELLKGKQIIYDSETIQELTENYNSEIAKSMKLNEEFNEIINNTSNFSLNHMQNLNANGRTISIDGKRKGGIFLSKESNIGYGSFINKNDFLEKIKNNKTYKLTNGTISNEDLKEIVNNIEQKISISKNEKNNSKTITDTKFNRKAGNLFLGKGIDLPNGDYVSVEELSLAVNKFITEKNRKAKKNKIIKLKGIFKASVAAASLAVSLLSTTISVNSKENIQSSVIQYDVDNFYSQNDQKLSNEIVDKGIHSVDYLINDLDNSKVENNNDVFLSEKIEENSIIENNIEENLNVENENMVIEKNNNETINNIEQSNDVEIKEDSNLDISLEQNDFEQNEERLINEENNIEQNDIAENSNIIENEEISENDELKTDDSNEEENVDQETNNETIENIATTELNEIPEINGNDVANYAVQFVGNPYVYGGTNLTDGTDCSGFTQSVYSNFGIDIARDSSSQINSGTNIGTNIEDAMPGDLLCFNGHVGIYIGNGQMVHAANPKRGIVINDVDYDKGKTLKAIVRPTGVNQIQEKTR